MAARYHSEICARAHAAMEELFGAGMLDSRAMHRFDVLCRSDVDVTHAAFEREPSDAMPPSPPRPAVVSHAPAPRPAAQQLQASRQAPPAGAKCSSGAGNNSLFYATTAQAVATAQRQFGPAELRALREREGVSETVFARCLNVLPQAVIAWEAGLTKPSPNSLRLLAAIDSRGLSVVA